MSFDITTNTSAMAALQSLTQTQQQLSATRGMQFRTGMSALSSAGQSGSAQGRAGVGDHVTFSFDSLGATSDAQARLDKLSRDAGLAGESAQISALSTRQQLGVQSLSIANQAPQSLLKLFG